jgi:hypothetical protein
MKRKFFREGQVNRSKHHPLLSGHSPLAYLPTENCSTCLYRGSRGKKDNEAPHIKDGSSSLSVLLLYFVEIITLLVVETITDTTMTTLTELTRDLCPSLT